MLSKLKISLASFVAALGLFLAPAVAHAAIAADASSTKANVASPSSPQTWTHTTGTLSNGALVCGVSLWQTVAGTGTVSGVTYNGTSMTKVQETNVGNQYSAIFVLAAPTSGANTVSATLSGASSTFGGACQSFSGVDQTTPSEATNEATGWSQNATVSTTTTTDNAWVVHALSHYGTEATTIGQGTQVFNSSANSITSAFGYVGPKTPAGAQTTNWTWGTNNRDWTISTLVLKPSSGLPSTFSWKGYTWTRRSGSGGPAHNGQWEPNNVSAPDGSDYVTLSITNAGSSPYSAEMYTTGATFGYGEYLTVVGTRLDTLDEPVVFGCMFTYDSAVTPHANEIDTCETSSWGNVVAPYVGHTMWYDNGGSNANHTDSYTATADAVTAHRLVWEPTRVTIDSFVTSTDGSLLDNTVYTSNVPTPAAEQADINLWTYNGGTVAGNTAAATSIVLRDFRFETLANRAKRQARMNFAF